MCKVVSQHTPLIKHQLLALHVAHGIWYEKSAVKSVFDDGGGDGLRAKGLRVKEVDAATFGCEGHVAVVAETCVVLW